MRSPWNVAALALLAGAALAGCLQRPPSAAPKQQPPARVAAVGSAASSTAGAAAGAASGAGSSAGTEAVGSGGQADAGATEDEPAAEADPQDEIAELLGELKRQQEASARATVEEIARAELAYAEEGDGSFATLEALAAAGRVSAGLLEGKDGYTFAVWLIGEGWVAAATAIEPGESGDLIYAATSAGVLFARAAVRPFTQAEWEGAEPPVETEAIGEWAPGALERWRAGEAARQAAEPTTPTDASDEPAASAGETGETAGGASPAPAAEAPTEAPVEGEDPALAEARVGLRAEDSAARRAAAEALAKLGPAAKPALAALVAAARDPAWEVRRAAVQALAAIGLGEEQVLEALTAALEDEQAEVRRAAYEALDQ